MIFRRWVSVLFPRGPGTGGVRPGTVIDDTGSVPGRNVLSIGDASGTSPCNPSKASGQQPTDIPLSAEVAVRAFFVEMMEWVAGEEMSFREVANNYKALSHMSPMLSPVSDKVLSQHLVGLGCKRRKAHKGGARPTMIRFPEYQNDKVVSIRRAVA
jgi:hypothetical protein